jgi:hypothetical protein
MDVSVSKLIKAPIDRVRDYLADADNDPTWRKNTTSSQRASGEVGEPGSVFEQVVLAMGNPMTVTVTLVDAGDEHLQFRGEGGMMPIDVRFDTLAADAGTELTLTVSLDVPPAMAKMATRMIQTDSDADLAQLAAVLEA